MFTRIAPIIVTLLPLWTTAHVTECNWFGGSNITVPLYPLNVCSSHAHEDELDGLVLYSTKMECHNGNVIRYEYNSTDCEGPTFNETTFTKGMIHWI